MTIRVLAAGALTTVQDLGRPGYGALGVAPSGAMDSWSLRIANRIVGNDDASACLEITIRGPSLAFESDAVVGISGSPFEVSVLIGLPGSSFERDVDTRAVPHGTAFRVHAGETLQIGRALAGARAYLAVRGGIVVPVVLGSRSTQVSAGMGGMEGRALSSGDVLPVGDAGKHLPLRRSTSPFEGRDVIRVLPGPQEDAFTPDGVRSFYAATYRASTRMDRTGLRLEGPPLAFAGAVDLDPEGVVTGAIQVPGDGLPIVLANDRPATGGYAKIATVIEADFGDLAHVRPGDTLRFTRSTREEARAALEERERMLEMIEDIE